MTHPITLLSFMTQSLEIEGMHRPPTPEELEVTRRFIGLKEIDIGDLTALVKIYQPDAILRDRPNLNVRVGKYIAPIGGKTLVKSLTGLLEDISARALSPLEAHVRYELLHPFTDGNGRSGRTLWLWMMDGQAPLNFLHHFYYQTLSAQRLPSSILKTLSATGEA